jgi:DNA-binding MarR family transcriptional regulator
MEDPLIALPGYALRRASSAMLAELGVRLAAHDLRPTEASILVLISVNRGITQSELCRALDVQRANMTPLVGRLEGRGLIIRSAVDGRSQGLALTDEGTSLAAQARAAMDAQESAIIERIPAEHRAHLLPALAALWQS